MADPFQWDGKNIHLQWGGGSNQEMNTACGVVLSTWAGPNARGKTTELSVGYTFERLHFVDCPKCRTWMETNLTRCERCCQPKISKRWPTCTKCDMEEVLSGVEVDADVRLV